MAGIFDRLRGWLRKKPAPRPKFGRGHRGVAAGDLKKPNLEDYARRLAGEHSEVAESEVEDFLFNEVPLVVNSSNVGSAIYYPKEGKMMITFLNGGRYMYSNVTEQEALQFVQSQSKGGFVWSVFRIRGTKNGHRKPFTKL